MLSTCCINPISVFFMKKIYILSSGICTDDMDRFYTMQVNSSFNGKRKMLRKSLQHLCTAYEIEKALEDIGLPATVQYYSLHRCIASLAYFIKIRPSLQS